MPIHLVLVGLLKFFVSLLSQMMTNACQMSLMYTFFMCSVIPDFNPCALITVISASSYFYAANSRTNWHVLSCAQVPTQPGQTSPLLQYFGILLDQAAIQTRRLVLLPSTYWIVICRYKSLSEYSSASKGSSFPIPICHIHIRKSSVILCKKAVHCTYM